MKVLILLMVLFTACTPIHEMRSVKKQQQASPQWMSLVEIKYSYGLNSRQCRQIVKAAYAGEIQCRYNMRRECAEYEANFDYSKFLQNGKHELTNKGN